MTPPPPTAGRTSTTRTWGWFPVCAVLALILVAVALVVVAYPWFVWPPFVAPGDALGIAMERENLLPEGATWRGGSARSVRVYGVDDPAEQDRVVESARRAMRRRGGPQGFESLEIEFWSGDAPPRGHGHDDRPRNGSALVRTVRIP